MFSWQVKKEGVSKASAKRVWEIFTNFERLPEWDESAESCKLFGPVAVGTEGQMQMKGQSPIRFVIEAVEKERLYRDKAKMFGATFSFSHQLIPLNNGVRIIHTFRVSGFLAPILRLFMKKKLELSMQKALENLIKMTETQQDYINQ